MGRAPCCDKANVKKGPWSPEEDAMLKAYIEEHGTVGNWIALPHNIGLKRCGKSCRLRWLNYLRPNIKHGAYSEEEDRIICSLYISIGSRWSIIAAQMPGRTDNDVKNYWNTRLKKKLLGRQKEAPIVEQDLDSSQTLTTSTVERLQLHLQLQGNLSNYHDMVDILPKASEMRDPQKVICADNIRFPKSLPSSTFLIEKELYELLLWRGHGLVERECVQCENFFNFIKFILKHLVIFNNIGLALINSLISNMEKIIYSDDYCA